MSDLHVIQKRDMKLYIVLPTYNEEKNIGPLLTRINQTMLDNNLKYEIILVNDGSHDNTLNIVSEYKSKLPLIILNHEANKGLGITMRDGLEKATQLCKDEDIIFSFDADNSHPPELMISMCQKIYEGNDVVIASRYRYGASIKGLSRFRKILSVGAYLLFSLILPIENVRDYTCGYRGYRGNILKKAFRQFNNNFVSEEGFQCQADILLKLRLLNIVFCEVPMVLRYDQKLGDSKMKVGSTVLKTLKLILKHRFSKI